MTRRSHVFAGATCADPPPLTASLQAAVWLLMGMALAFFAVLQTPAAAQPLDLGRDRPIILPERPILCAPPRVMQNGRCVRPDRPILCPPPRVMRGGRCEMPERPAVCLPPRVMRNGRCVLPAPVICTPPRVMQNGRCVMPPVICRPPQVRRGNRCVMPERPEVCRPPMVMRGGRCVAPPVICRPPEVRRGNRCVMPERPPVCRLPYIYSARERRCILPVPVPPIVTPPACIAPWQYSRSAGGCICPSGYVVDRGECVRRDSQACTFPFVYSSNENRCVCAQRYRPFGAGCAPERPAPTPQENISWIQACLNAAGYDAGPIDGLTGRRTRDAWTSFREDSDLGTDEAPYTDPETLAKLFAACNPAGENGNGATTSDTGTDEDTDAEGKETGDTDAVPSAGPFAATPALCASGRLYGLLSAEDESLEPCGRSCIPAPEGMSEEELFQQQERQGITWCRSCVTVGALGMLCPAAASDEDTATGTKETAN